MKIAAVFYSSGNKWHGIRTCRCLLARRLCGSCGACPSLSMSRRLNQSIHGSLMWRSAQWDRPGMSPGPFFLLRNWNHYRLWCFRRPQDVVFDEY